VHPQPVASLTGQKRKQAWPKKSIFRRGCAGYCAGFKAGDPDGHCLQNCGTAAAVVLEICSRIPGEYATYSDIDMKTEPGVEYVHKDGKPYPNTTRRGPG